MLRHLKTSLLAAAALMVTPFALATDADGKPDLWQVSDGDSSVWIYGTFHILPDGLDWQKEALAERIADADRIFFELDSDDPQLQLKTQQAMIPVAFAPGSMLSSHLTEAEFQKLVNLMASLQLQEAQVEAARPWFAFLTGSVAALVQAGYNPESGVEETLSAIVAEQGKDIEGLETIDYQIGVLAGAPDEESIKVLKSTLAQLDDIETETERMLQAWLGDDYADLEAILNEGLSASPILYDRLLTERNKNWVPVIDGLLADNEKGFIAVGAGHLPGKEGVLQLLRDKGYTVTRH